VRFKPYKRQKERRLDGMGVGGFVWGM